MHIIAYFSQIQVPARDVTCELEEIAKVSQKNNRENNITGALLCEGSHFLQLIEGKKAKLDQLFEKIKIDSRHTDITVLINEPTNKRTCPDWSMEAFHLANPDLVNKKTLKNLHRIYSHNFTTNAKTFLTFFRDMLDQLDTFKILHESV
ncbi:MAG: BLUF domain-containing protein [Marinicaulis sp.]|nr:BLUF domain-containing protein [Marinicaulis sp.]NNL88752.1 BLUF domain-containing protein [Marinicaulis sp.]